MSGRVVVAGAGQAAAQLAESLRKGGWSGPITLIGDEPFPPYQRPPLSKAYLAGAFARERLFLKGPEFYADNDIALRLGARVATADRAGKRAILENGESLPYDALVFATGARARPYEGPGAGLKGVHMIRSIADIDRLAPEVAPGKRAVILGGGWIGLEAAAALRARGLEATLIHRSPWLLSRVASAETAEAFRKIHEAEGVEIRLNATIRALEGDGRLERAIIGDEVLSVDLAVIGVGALPNEAPARAAGLKTQDGVCCDADCRTNDPAIFAIGDCAVRDDPRYGPIRLESVQNAIDSAKIAAAAILGQPRPREQAPWFWSDQFDVKFQSAGLPTSYDRAIERRGAGRSLSVWLYRGGRLIAVEALNDARAYMTGKRWIEAGVSPDPQALADPSRDLKTLA